MILGILGSGSGSNMQAILDAIAAGTLDARIALVLSDNPDGHILERARKNGIESGVIDCRGFRTKFSDEAQRETAARLKAAGVELVCLAGFMRLVKRPLLEAFPERIINIHPALLPAFPGLEAWKQALDAGVSETGATVHYVDAGMDTGPAILQEKVPVLPGDTAESLHARIQQAEHRIYPEAIRQLAASRSVR
ncbi:MAG TPA: phosphoribosylglycinamide formyltransferase [Luteolibacter sp.]|nr:phosphoribosylglycinamide formyltransferase [Luteolibacter sp.]